MRTIRIFFSKTGEAAYISHLDLQRVMARALRRSGIPVWYSQGFNPHIYISFALPLPLMQESVTESMDCKTEADLDDFSGFIAPLNAALPKGLVVSKIAPPVYSAAQIETAEYHIAYPDRTPEQVGELVAQYNALPKAMVVRKTKRTQQEMDLKLLVPSIQALQGEAAFVALLPAGSQLNINPNLLTSLLQQQFGFAEAGAAVKRTQVYTVNGQPFC
ncbi:TIGR03936 family radical SAM-associated protein [Ruminococcaceae bacterium OttesenSCG-928-A16]|nr:TIGR03936 family radical SAM-associated protein [Ruminococcaceae bacterium OttesenSCG-928-A16]